METVSPSPVKLPNFVLSILKCVFSKVYLCGCSVVTLSLDSLPLVSVCDSKPLKKFVGIEDVPAFYIKACSVFFCTYPEIYSQS
jgi:hypothetical protein